MPDSLYVGLMTGTSVDAVDAVLVRFSADHADIIATRKHPIPSRLQQQLSALIASPDRVSLDQLGILDSELGRLYAEAVAALLKTADTPADAVRAIGSHGQTVRHRPDTQPPFSLQLGDAAALAALSGITTVSDFRRADIALGGQGAPLAPAFHAWAFTNPESCRVIVNIGGIANITVLEPGQPVIGFDTGPGNTLLDTWVCEHLGYAFDDGGQWAAAGAPDNTLLQTMLNDPYFALPAPKSTGREYFNPKWMEAFAATRQLAPHDVQATLAELTAASIAAAISARAPAADIGICGGGAFNTDLLSRIRRRLPTCNVDTTRAYGLPPEWIEAVAFAWLARARLHGVAGNLTSVTGARQSAVLGCVHSTREA